ncbi:MAB_1171c family putative transporter [Actinoplanes sp. NPDC051494]|uniref:MAB_1171c family putative transporter n=1 Tax=Actinoplanes sp. NPDC051494 TaxID=3363907 RepID=UPI00379EC0C1
MSAVVLVLLWGTALARVPALWRDAAQRAMWATILMLALVKTAAAPAVNTRLGHLVPHPEVVPHLLGVATAFFLLRFIALITGYHTGRRWAAHGQLLLALVVLAALPPLIGTEAYWVVLDGYLGVLLTVAGIIFWRAGAAAPAGLLRVGLRAIAVGVFVYALYAVTKIGLILFATPAVLATVEPVANAVRAGGTILAVLGATVPAGSSLRRVVRGYRSLWRMRPLWDVMRRTFPDVILFSRRRALVELSGAEEVQLRVYRRVIEIRDGMLALRAYLPGDALRRAADFLGDDSTPELVEASGIALALRRHGLGAEADAPATGWTAGDDADLAGEVAWLGGVSDAFRRPEPAGFAQLSPLR